MSRQGHSPATFRFSLEDAARAKLAGDNWQKYPAAMLRARVITAAARAYAPDVLDGVYDPDELSPGPGPAVTVAPPAAKPTKTEKVKAALAAKPSPPVTQTSAGIVDVPPGISEEEAASILASERAQAEPGSRG